MGASASKSTTLGNNAGSQWQATLTASFTENSTSIANNTSSVTVTATQKVGNFDWSSSSSSTLKIYWYDDNANNGGKLVATTSATSQGRNATITASGTITVSHKADGSLNGYAKAVWTKAGGSSWTPNSGNISTNTTALDNIPRAATITSAPDFNDTDNPTITYSNPAGSSASLRACISLTGAAADVPYRSISSTGSSYTFNLTEAERNTLRQAAANSKTLNVYFFIETTVGSTVNKNYALRTMTIVNANPTFSTSYKDTNSSTVAITGNNQQIIRSNSTLQVSIANATALKYATLTSATCQINGTTYGGTLSNGSCTFNIGALNISSNTTAAVKVTDSRGNSTTNNLTLQILDWTPPTAVVSLQRQSNFYSETDIRANASYSSLDGNNTVTIKYRYQKADVENLFDYASCYKPTVAGLTNTLNDDGSLTTTGTPTLTYQHITADQSIDNILVDGQLYTISQTVASSLLAIEVRATKTSDSSYQYWNCRSDSSNSTTFTVDFSTYTDYQIWVITDNNTTTPINITNNYVLQKGTTDWSAWNNLSNNTTATFTIDNGNAWTVEVVVSDRIGSTTYSFTVPHGTPIMFFDDTKSSVGVNCFPKGNKTLEVNGKNIMPITLYNNDNGINSSLTLNDNAANYSYIEVFFRSNDNVHGSTRVADPNNKNVCLMSTMPILSSGNSAYLKSAVININGTSVSVAQSSDINLTTSGITIYNSNPIYITKIVGWE